MVLPEELVPLAEGSKSCLKITSEELARIHRVTLGILPSEVQKKNEAATSACQRSMLCAQHTLRLTMQHVYGHTGNLGNECADHAAALGSLGLISSHNVAARWVRCLL